MEVIKTPIPGVVVVIPAVFKDKRGFFLESYRADRYEECGIPARFVQDNHSKSVKSTLRGLHFQNPKSQGKLVRVVQGEVFDVAVDVRLDSPTFGKHYATVLSAENMRQMYVPEGFAHGFCVMSETAEFEYKCTDLYAPECEVGIRWDDPMLAIEWPVEAPLLSEKDMTYPLLEDVPENLLPKYVGGESNA